MSDETFIFTMQHIEHDIDFLKEISERLAKAKEGDAASMEYVETMLHDWTQELEDMVAES